MFNWSTYVQSWTTFCSSSTKGVAAGPLDYQPKLHAQKTGKIPQNQVRCPPKWVIFTPAIPGRFLLGTCLWSCIWAYLDVSPPFHNLLQPRSLVKFHQKGWPVTCYLLYIHPWNQRLDTQNDGLGGSVLTLVSCRGVDGLEKVVPFPNLRRDESSQSTHLLNMAMFGIYVKFLRGYPRHLGEYLVNGVWWVCFWAPMFFLRRCLDWMSRDTTSHKKVVLFSRLSMGSLLLGNTSKAWLNRNTIVSFWGPAYFHGPCFRECRLVKKCPLTSKPKKTQSCKSW